jgi:hypothetical protein
MFYIRHEYVYMAQDIFKMILSEFCVQNGVFDDICSSPHTGEAETLCFVLERGAK